MRASLTSRCSGRPDERIRSGRNPGRTSVRPYNKDALREDHTQHIHCATSRVARRIGSPRVAGTAGFVGAELARPDATARKAQPGWMARTSHGGCVARRSHATYSLRHQPGSLPYRVHPGATGGLITISPYGTWFTQVTCAAVFVGVERVRPNVTTRRMQHHP